MITLLPLAELGGSMRLSVNASSISGYQKAEKNEDGSKARGPGVVGRRWEAKLMPQVDVPS